MASTRVRLLMHMYLPSSYSTTYALHPPELKMLIVIMLLEAHMVFVAVVVTSLSCIHDNVQCVLLVCMTQKVCKNIQFEDSPIAYAVELHTTR